MLVGHYSAAFVAKSAQPRVPLWTLLLAAQAVDVLWAVFVLAGIERVRFDTSLASNPLDLYHMPFTHSLLGSLGWGIVAFALARWWFASTGGALAVAATVVSHWFLDLLVHRPDLTLWGARSAKLGLGLWNYPVTAVLVEFGLLGATLWMYLRTDLPGPARRGLLILVAVLAVVQLALTVTPPPVSTTQLGVSSLVLFLAVTGAGALVERRAVRPTGAALR
jgi:hypothetical protein